MKEISQTRFVLSKDAPKRYQRTKLNGQAGVFITQTLNEKDFDSWVNNTIADLFKVNVTDLETQEKEIKASRGFFWNKIVRRIFGYKFDILRMRNNVSEEKRMAFNAAVRKIDYETNLEIDTLLKGSNRRFDAQQNEINVIKKDLQQIIFKEEGVFVEGDVINKAFVDFLKQSGWGKNFRAGFLKALTKDKKKFQDEFKVFFHKRVVSFDKKTRKNLDADIQTDLKTSSSDRFIKDAIRTGNVDKYGVINIEGSKIFFDIKKVTKLEGVGDDKDEMKRQCENDLHIFKGKLATALEGKKLSKENIGKFTEFIVYLGAQTAEVVFLKNLIISSIFRQGEQFITGFDLRKDFLDIQIEIKDENTLKMTIEAKDSKKLFTTQKLIGIGAEAWNLAIKNPKTETTFKLDETGEWKVEDVKVSFLMEKAEEAKEAK